MREVMREGLQVKAEITALNIRNEQKSITECTRCKTLRQIDQNWLKCHLVIYLEFTL